MKSHPPRYLKAALAVAAVCLCSAAATSAQTTNRRAAENRTGTNQRELRELGKKTTDSMYMAMTLEQVNEDFEHLKAANNEIVRMLASRDGLNFRRVADAAGKVNERAVHVRKSLMLPEPEKEEKEKEAEGPGAEQMKPWLRALSDLIASFVTNPVFQSEKEVDQKLAAQARRDLEEIVSLSEAIKRSAQRIEKGRVK